MITYLRKTGPLIASVHLNRAVAWQGLMFRICLAVNSNRICKLKMVRLILPIHGLPDNYYGVSLKDLVLDQLIIPSYIFFLRYHHLSLDIVLILC